VTALHIAMGRTFRSALIAAALISTSVVPVEAQMPHASVVVHNRSRLLTHTVADAQKIVDRVFASAGVQLVWLPRLPSNLSAPVEWPIIRIIVVAKEAAQAIGYRRDALGFTPGSKSGDAWLAYVLGHRVSAVARGYRARPAVVLASAIAHEMGHMLLSARHSRTGVMRTTFNQSDFRKIAAGDLMFTSLEAAEIRARLSVRDAYLRANAGRLAR
jgi:hypothetical protein